MVNLFFRAVKEREGIDISFILQFGQLFIIILEMQFMMKWSVFLISL